SIKGARARLDDEQRPGTADGHGRPTPPAHALAEEQRGCSGEAERGYLQNAHQVREGHACKCGLEKDRAAHVADGSPAHAAHERILEPIDRAGPERGDGNDGNARQAAHAYGLTGRQAGGDKLHGGIAAGEECGCRDHGGDAPDIVASSRAGPRICPKQTAAPWPRLLHALPPSLSRGAIPILGSLPPFGRAAQASARDRNGVRTLGSRHCPREVPSMTQWALVLRSASSTRIENAARPV